MTFLNLPLNTKVALDGLVCTVASRLKDDTKALVLVENETQRPHTLTDKELAIAIQQGRASLVDGLPARRRDGQSDPMVLDFATQKESYKARANWAAAYVNEALARHVPAFTDRHLKPVIAAVKERIGDPHPPEADTLKKWLLKARRFPRGGIRLHVPGYARCGTKGSGSRVNSAARAMAEAVIDELLLTPTPYDGVEIHGEIERRIEKMNKTLPENQKIKIPSVRTVQRMIAEIDAKSLCIAHEGPAQAAHKHRRAGIVKRPTLPLDLVQIDHTTVPVICYDMEKGIPLGRPTITAMIDACTTAIIGWFVSFQSPSYYAAAKCLRIAIETKDDLVAQYPDVPGRWDMFGVPRMIGSDNDSNLVGTSFEDACKELAIDIYNGPPGKPWLRGTIESWFRTFSRKFCRPIPSTTFSNPQERGDREMPESWGVPIQILKENLMDWVINVYNASPKRGIPRRGFKAVPAQLWAELVAKNPVDPVPDVSFLQGLIGQLDERKLTDNGFEFKGLTYNQGPYIRELRARGVEGKQPIKFDPENIGKLYFKHPDTGQWLPVGCDDPEYAEGLAIWAHKQIMAEAHAKVGRSVNRQERLEAEKRIRDRLKPYIEGATMHANRKRARFDEGVNRPTPQATPPEQRGGAISAAINQATAKPPAAQRPQPEPLSHEQELARFDAMARERGLGGEIVMKEDQQ